jgi:hypothetical protein
LFLWQWRRQRTQAQQDEVFGSYMRKVAGVERRAAELELADTLQLDPLIDLQRELLTLKTEALDRFAAGDIGGQAALEDLLAPMNTARDHIGELILHVRDSIEGEAAAEGRTPQALVRGKKPRPRRKRVTGGAAFRCGQAVFAPP